MSWYNPFTWGDNEDEQVSFSDVPEYTPPAPQYSKLPEGFSNPYAASPGWENPNGHDPSMAVASPEYYAEGDARDPVGGFWSPDGSKTPSAYLGTTYETGYYDYLASNHGEDNRSYMYGRSPGAADAAVDKAWATGDEGLQTGRDIYGAGWQTAGNYADRVGPQGNWAAPNAALAGAESYGDQLAGLEATEGPSAAQAQLRSGTNQALNSQIALARSGRGFGGGAAATGLAQGNLASLQANNANQAAALRAQENAAWRGRRAGNLGAAAGINTTIAGQRGQQASADLQANLQTQAANDAAALQWAGLGTDAYFKGQGSSMAGQSLGNEIRGSELSAGIAHEDADLRRWAAESGYELQQAQQDDQKEAAYIGAGATTIAALSDVRAKENIEEDPDAALEFARSLAYDSGSGIYRMNDKPTRMQAAAAVEPEPTARVGGTEVPRNASFDREALDAVAKTEGAFYDYKNPSAVGAAPGTKYGPMAQDYAKTPAGSTVLTETPDGKLGIDQGRAELLNSSALAAQQAQLDSILAELDSFRSERTDYGFDMGERDAAFRYGRDGAKVERDMAARPGRDRFEYRYLGGER